MKQPDFVSDDHDVILMSGEREAEAFIASNRVVICFFTAPACSVCHAVKPRLIELAKRYQLPVMLVSVDQYVAHAAERLIFTVPKVLIVHKGREISRESRYINFEHLERTMSLITNQPLWHNINT